MKYDLIAPCYFGTESAAAFDFKRIGAEDVAVTDGRVAFRGGPDIIAAANLWSRCAERLHSLARQFGPEAWTLYKGLPLLSFADNHDVTRVATILTNKEHLWPLYGILFGMPGVPCVYYGSEWGMEGGKEDGDAALRPAVDMPQKNGLTEYIARLAAARRGSRALCHGAYRTVLLTNRQYIFERAAEGERVLVAVNAEGEPFDAHFDAGAGRAVDLVTGRPHDFGGGSRLAPYSAAYWRVE